jgi:2-polyprenyl-3-methyl-5-hydroxy-6-metoxy-1,4-benzoquinol methylase
VSDVVEQNLAFYTPHYRRRTPIAHLARARVSFDQQSKSRLNWSMLKPILPELVRAGIPVRILDYGAGWGSFLLAAPRGPYAAYAYDLVDSAVANIAATMTFLGRDFSPARVDATGSLEPAPFDVIVCSHVLEHVADDSELVARFTRALRKGGYLLINVPINEVTADPKHARAYDTSTLTRCLECAGLEVVRTLAADRFTAALLTHEARATRAVTRAMLRASRALLATLPLRLVASLEDVLASRYPAQQLLALARKPA